MIDEIGLETYERDGAQVGMDEGRLADFSGEMDEVFEPLEELEDWTGPDYSFAEFLDRKGVEENERLEMVGYVEGFNAADHRVISVASLGAQQKAEDATEGDRLFRVRDGLRPAAGVSCDEGGGVRRKGSDWLPGGGDSVDC